VAEPIIGKTYIPLRFVEARSSAGLGPLHPLGRIQQAVARTNAIWSYARIAFWIRSIETFHMPRLHRYVRDKPKDAEGCPGGNACFTWAQVRDELRQVFPNMPANAYPDTDVKSAAYWLVSAPTLYGDPNEIVAWLLEEEGGSGGATAPWGGRMLYFRRSAIWADSAGIPSTTLPHEIGHFFAPRHLNDPSLAEGYNHCDRWDQVFIPGTPNTFFSSKNDRDCEAGEVQYIAIAMDSISSDTPWGPVHVVLNNHEYVASGSHVDDELKGLFTSSGLPHNPPATWGFAMNIMGGIGLDGSDIDPSVPRFFSASQVEMINDFLTRDIHFLQDYEKLLLTNGGLLPTGAIPGALTSLRTKLGKRWQNLGGEITAPPAVASWGPNRLDIFVRGESGRVFHKAWSGSAWDPHGTRWQNLGGEILGPPAVVSWGPNRLDVFVRGESGAVFHKAWSGTGWDPPGTQWQNLGGKSTHAPAVASWGRNRLDVFVRGESGAVFHKAWSGSAWDPPGTQWQNLGGKIVGPPVVVSWGPNRLDIFVRGESGAVFHKAWSGSGWDPPGTQWQNLGGKSTHAPAVASWGRNRLDVFVRGEHGGVFHKAWSGSGWDPSGTQWQNLGGKIVGPPSPVSWGPGHLSVFVRGEHGSVFHKAWLDFQWDPPGTKWQNLGGEIIGPPAVASWSPGRLDVFVRGEGGGVFHKVWDGSKWS
jgi:hypothetical protein